ncbi:MAG: glycosyltransferase family 39 protein [Deltaproteobacteria bacterium]|nr:glycosyltransferase family 39 protein [Deltaproteobacteria bacterium]
MNRTHRAIAALLLLALALQCIMSMRQKSLTEDEYVHIPAGLSYLRTNDFRLNLDEPPLMKLLAAAPLLAWRPKLYLPLEDPSWHEKNAWRFARRFFDTHRRDLDIIAFLARLPTVILSLLLGMVVCRWSTTLYGPWAGLFALTLYTFDPNILAHTRLATMDLGISLFITAALYAWWRFHRAPSPGNLLCAGLMVGLAATTKFSGLILIPLTFVLMIPGRMLEKEIVAQIQNRWRGLIRGCVRWMGVLIIAGMVIFLFYGMEFKPLATDPEMISKLKTAASSSHKPTWKKLGFRAAVEAPIPAPSYFKGISYLMRHFRQGHDAYLMGQYSKHGWWYYFIVSTLIKTTIPFLLLILLSMLPFSKAPSLMWKDRIFLLAPPLVFYAMALTSPMNIGHRHILPIYPFLFIWCSRLVVRIPRRWGWYALMAVLVLWHAVSAVGIYPHYLAYFNGLIGGPKNGPRYLLDSNIDWGQDLILLRKYLHRERISDLHMDLRGNVNPSYYGVAGKSITPYRALHPMPGNYAIRVNELYNLHHRNKRRFQWLREREPAARVGYSIYVYRVPVAAALAAQPRQEGENTARGP